MMHDDGRDFLTNNEAAEILRISSRTLERLRETGTGPEYFKVGRRVLYRRATLLAWLEAHRYASPSQWRASNDA